MSYEGYYQVICMNGHYSAPDVYEHPNFGRGGEFISDEIWTCRCGAHAAWINMVDLTNGSFCDCGIEDGCECCDDGRIDGYVELQIKKHAEVKVCPCCGGESKVSEVEYFIPENKGAKLCLV